MPDEVRFNRLAKLLGYSKGAANDKTYADFDRTWHKDNELNGEPAPNAPTEAQLLAVKDADELEGLRNLKKAELEKAYYAAEIEDFSPSNASDWTEVGQEVINGDPKITGESLVLQMDLLSQQKWGMVWTKAINSPDETRTVIAKNNSRYTASSAVCIATINEAFNRNEALKVEIRRKKNALENSTTKAAIEAIDARPGM